jgi:hypothetical protein
MRLVKILQISILFKLNECFPKSDRFCNVAASFINFNQT